MKTYPVIMAGGGGLRFWPLSRRSRPKQLLNLSGKDVMINETIERLTRIAAKDDIYIVTNAGLKREMAEATKGRIPAGNIFYEPSARNTAACIGYAAFKLRQLHGDGVMVVSPSDAYIGEEEEYARILRAAVRAAQETDSLVTVGVTPTFPATGYGYIEFAGDGRVKKVRKFVEKPDEDRAKEYIASGGYVWNSGVFVWKTSVILEKFRKLLPDLYSGLERIAAAFGSPEEEQILNEVYPQLRSVSVDYGIMEKCDDILVVTGEFGWSDVGSWDRIDALHPADRNGNVTFGDAWVLDGKDTTVYSTGRCVAAIGVEDLVIVETKDAVMVCRRSNAQDVKKIVEMLKEKGRNELL